MRLIDADVVVENIEEWLNSVGTAIIGKGISYTGELMGCIEDAQTVDAVHVVRCRECKHYEFGVCLKIYSDGNASKDAWQERKPDDFCSYGERKEGAD